MSESGDVESHDWFVPWLDRIQPSSLLLVRQRSVPEVLGTLGVESIRRVTVAEAIAAGDGTNWALAATWQDWTYAITPPRPDIWQITERLSQRSGETIAISRSATISLLLFGRNGAVAAGLDIDAPHVTYGTDAGELALTEGTGGPALVGRLVRAQAGLQLGDVLQVEPQEGGLILRPGGHQSRLRAIGDSADWAMRPPPGPPRIV